MEIGLLGLVILALDIYAVIQILGSGTSGGKKLLWIVLIFFLPVVGLILWAIFGPRRGKA